MATPVPWLASVGGQPARPGAWSEIRGENQLAEQVIMALTNAVEAKDRYTNGHSERVAAYAAELVRRMGWDDQRREHVYYAGLLHDVGKIRVADAIINKQGRLTSSEYEEMKLHTLAGYYILKEISAVSDFAVGARWHHERYDGRGYPNGLSGENIPKIARVICVADAYDAMTSDRSYRETLPQAKVREEIERGAGFQFDPEVARIMLSMIDEDEAFHMRQPSRLVCPRIVAIDDDPMTLKLLQFTLGRDGSYEVVTASSAEEGTALVEAECPDLVLLDVEMPGMDGFDVLSWVRSRYPDLPVVFMTGDKEMDIIARAEEMGISDYLTKPLVPSMLHASIENILINSMYAY